MPLEAQDSPTTRTTCRILILLFIVISVQATDGSVMTLMRPLHPPSLLAEATFVFVLANCNFHLLIRSVGRSVSHIC